MVVSRKIASRTFCRACAQVAELDAIRPAASPAVFWRSAARISAARRPEAYVVCVKTTYAIGGSSQIEKSFGPNPKLWASKDERAI